MSEGVREIPWSVRLYELPEIAGTVLGADGTPQPNVLISSRGLRPPIWEITDEQGAYRIGPYVEGVHGARRHAGQVIWIACDAEHRIERVRAGPELRHVRLANHNRSGRFESLDEQGVLVRHVVFVDRGSVGSRDPLRVHQILDGNRQSVERTGSVATGLSLVVLVVSTSLFLAAAAWLFSRREYVLEQWGRN